MQALELKIPPLAFAIMLAVAMWFVAGIVPFFSFSLPGHFLVITTLAATGVLISLSGVLAFHQAQTTVDPRKPASSSALMSTGVYGVSRNPMYLGFLLALAAWAIYVSNLLAFTALPAFVAYLNRFQIIPEERALRAKFGSSFDDYERAVRRWL